MKQSTRPSPVTTSRCFHHLPLARQQLAAALSEVGGAMVRHPCPRRTLMDCSISIPSGIRQLQFANTTPSSQEHCASRSLPTQVQLVSCTQGQCVSAQLCGAGQAAVPGGRPFYARTPAETRQIPGPAPRHAVALCADGGQRYGVTTRHAVLCESAMHVCCVIVNTRVRSMP